MKGIKENNLPIFVHFRKARFLVPIRHLIAYLRWSQMTLNGDLYWLRKLITSIWQPRLIFRVDQEVQLAITACKILEFEVGWVRYPTDGTRLQVFDPGTNTVCKAAKAKAGINSILRELKWRKKVGDLAPPVTDVCENPPAYIEDWVKGQSVGMSWEELRRIVARLDERLYEVQWVELDEYLDLAAMPFSPERVGFLVEALHILGWDKVPSSPVHGDLVSQNILFRADDEPILIDWEYSRVCAVSHDLWFYLYHRAQIIVRGVVLPASFFQDVELALGWLGLQVKNVHALHLFHLLEREALLSHNSSDVSSAAAIAMLRADIERSSVSLGISNRMLSSVVR